MKYLPNPTRCLALCAPFSLLVLTGCNHAPLGRSTAEYSSPSLSASGHTFVLPRASAGNVAPVYPVDLRRRVTEGRVNVDCVIDETGHVLAANVGSSTNQALNRPTLDAVRGWTFEPGTRDGVPTAMRLNQTVEFLMAP